MLAAIMFAAVPSADASCFIFPGATYGESSFFRSNVTSPEDCCAGCGSDLRCAAWTFHRDTGECFLKDNVRTLRPPRKVDPANATMTGLRPGVSTCSSGDICTEGWPCPSCGQVTSPLTAALFSMAQMVPFDRRRSSEIRKLTRVLFLFRTVAGHRQHAAARDLVHPRAMRLHAPLPTTCIRSATPLWPSLTASTT